MFSALPLRPSRPPLCIACAGDAGPCGAPLCRELAGQEALAGRSTGASCPPGLLGGVFPTTGPARCEWSGALKFRRAVFRVRRPSWPAQAWHRMRPARAPGRALSCRFPGPRSATGPPSAGLAHAHVLADAAPAGGPGSRWQTALERSGDPRGRRVGARARAEAEWPAVRGGGDLIPGAAGKEPPLRALASSTDVVTNGARRSAACTKGAAGQRAPGTSTADRIRPDGRRRLTPPPGRARLIRREGTSLGWVSRHHQGGPDAHRDQGGANWQSLTTFD